VAANKAGGGLGLAERPSVKSESDLLFTLGSSLSRSCLCKVGNAGTTTTFEFSLVHFDILSTVFLPPLKIHKHFRPKPVN
jgi:hypothetical protein